MARAIRRISSEGICRTTLPVDSSTSCTTICLVAGSAWIAKCKLDEPAVLSVALTSVGAGVSETRACSTLGLVSAAGRPVIIALIGGTCMLGHRKLAELMGAPPVTVIDVALPEQLQYGLLHLVRLLQSGNTGLLQDIEFGHVSNFLRDVRGADRALSLSQVLHLVGDNVTRAL